MRTKRRENLEHLRAILPVVDYIIVERWNPTLRGTLAAGPFLYWPFETCLQFQILPPQSRDQKSWEQSKAGNISGGICYGTVGPRLRAPKSREAPVGGTCIHPGGPRGREILQAERC
ncbi:hypothetical protein J6590_001360 [Homalodisca vitripennis]|nr:hypothetical protein J6590_001360 [Homalodisca vitripennis]